jgi:hypothetical protein
MKKGYLLGVAVALIVAIVVTAALSLQPANEPTPENAPGKSKLHYTLTYSYFIEGDPYLSPQTKEALEKWGKIEHITPAAAEVKTYTQIPAFENDAKGTHPAYVLFPELNGADYKYGSWMDKPTGMSVSGCYRMVGGMTTDEKIKIYVDASGEIVKYETINLGKYDALGLDGAKLENLHSTFTNRVIDKMRAVISQHSSAVEEQTTYRIFTDSLGRIVITTNISIQQLEAYSETLKVELYAIVK